MQQITEEHLGKFLAMISDLKCKLEAQYRRSARREAVEACGSVDSSFFGQTMEAIEIEHEKERDKILAGIRNLKFAAAEAERQINIEKAVNASLALIEGNE